MKINEIFYSIQGEGYHAGSAAVFVRFSGCNLKCWFCDTKHESGEEMTEEEIVEKVKSYSCDFCVLTGGEPTMQATASLIEKMHAEGLYVAVETNGTHEIPKGIDWVTCSPKSKNVKIDFCNELKVVYPCKYINDLKIESECKYIQPCDEGNPLANEQNTENAINFIKSNPEWKLSLQLQKILRVR